MRIRNIYKTLELCGWDGGRFLRIIRCNKRIPSATHAAEQAFMFRTLLKLSAPGAAVECGSYKGSSSAVLSMACRLTKRRLHIFDSFRGLPQPSETDARHQIVGEGTVHVYQKSAWAGSLDEVRSNIGQYGDLSVCEFHEGYFDKTLPYFREPVAFVFCDVDLRDSLETCLRYLWPLIADEGVFFTHEAHHYEIAELFYDREWWQEHLNCGPPGLVGGGSGLGLYAHDLGFAQSALGFTIKNPAHTADSFQLGAQETYVVRK